MRSRLRESLNGNRHSSPRCLLLVRKSMALHFAPLRCSTRSSIGWLIGVFSIALFAMCIVLHVFRVYANTSHVWTSHTRNYIIVLLLDHVDKALSFAFLRSRLSNQSFPKFSSLNIRISRIRRDTNQSSSSLFVTLHRFAWFVSKLEGS